MLFALALASIIVLGTEVLVDRERAYAHADLMAQAKNLSVVFAQNVGHTVEDLDRILKFVRSSHEDNPAASWDTILAHDYTVDDEALQISIADANGIMLASTVASPETKRVDIGDREHFLVQKRSRMDTLFISKPVVGRVSGKPSVQFTRRLSGPRGAFGGVVVGSLDPKHLAKAYAAIDAGAGFGLALVGEDGIVRAGTGTFEALLGKVFPRSDRLTNLFKAEEGPVLGLDDDTTIQMTERVSGYPLCVVVSVPGIAFHTAYLTTTRDYRIAAYLGAMLTLVAAAIAARRSYRYEQRIVALAERDALTGLPNRLLLNARLSSLAQGARANRRWAFALHLIDLDGFKLVNDTYGHPVGDKLLCLVSARLLSIAPPDGLVSRMGGDEFAILQPLHDGDKSAEKLAQNVITSLTAPFSLGEFDVSVGVSVGSAFASDDTDGAVALVKAADLALYSAKSAGRGSFRFFEPSMAADMHLRQQLELDLRSAVAGAQFELHYQPILDVDSGIIVSFEALLRWNHPLRGRVAPNDFIPIAEETGLIVEIGKWVLSAACAEAAGWAQPIKIAVNLSPRQILGGKIVADVGEALSRSGLPPSRLELEVTELAMLADDRSTIESLQSLRHLGVRIAMDDFGTGYSSVSYLRRFPFDKIKIDQSFTRDMLETPRTLSIIRAVIALAFGMDMSVTAEGVETDEQLKLLRAEGCDEIQGYFISPPMPRQEVVTFLKEWPQRAAQQQRLPRAL